MLLLLLLYRAMSYAVRVHTAQQIHLILNLSELRNYMQ